jgi:hypothetical protein
MTELTSKPNSTTGKKKKEQLQKTAGPSGCVLPKLYFHS